MRIAIVSRAENVSGKEIMTLELGDGLRKAGHEVSFITSRWNDGHYVSRLQAMGFALRRLDLGSISATLHWDCLRMTGWQLLRLPGLWADYRRFLCAEQPERVIHTSWHHLLLLWPFLNQERDWYWSHEVLPDKPQYRGVFARLARRLRGFVAVSEAVGQSLRSLHVPAEKVHVVHNGLSDFSTPDHEMRSSSRGRIGIVGQVEPWKGHEHLFMVFARMRDRHPAASLHIYGEGPPPYIQRLEKLAGELGIRDRVTWHGFVTDRVAIYRKLDVNVVPSQAPDPLPTVAIEAAYFGLPVVASNSGGLPEIVEHGVTGFLVDAKDVEEWSMRLDELLSDAELRRRLGKAARQMALSRFAHERFVFDFLHLMEAPKAGSMSEYHPES